MNSEENHLSGFYIANNFDKPCEELLAEKRSDGRFYYVHPSMTGVADRGMQPENPTPVEAFGLMVDVAGGVLVGVIDDSATIEATYDDGSPRRWQGKKMFSFMYERQSEPTPYSVDKNSSMLELIDGAYDIIEIWKAETPAQIRWKMAWLARARELGASPSW